MANLLFSQLNNEKKVDLGKNTLQIDTVSAFDVTLSGEKQDILIARALITHDKESGTAIFLEDRGSSSDMRLAGVV